MTDSKSVEKLRASINKAFSCFDKNSTGTIHVDDVGAVMRYLGQFPSEGELLDVIHKRLMEDSGQGTNISYAAFEKLMLGSLVEHEHDPDDGNTLLEAFRTLDTDKKGWLELEKVKEFLTSGHASLREKEVNEFVDFAKNQDEQDKIYYEDYIFNLTRFVDRHLDKLYEDVRAGSSSRG